MHDPEIDRLGGPTIAPSDDFIDGLRGRIVGEWRRETRRRRPPRHVWSWVAASAVVAGVVVGSVMLAQSEGHRSLAPGVTAGTATDPSTSAPLLVPATSHVPPLTSPENLLVVGVSDGLCGPSGAAASTESGAVTIMVLHVDPVAHELAILSLPKDLWVQIPGRAPGRISSAFNPNDLALLSQTVSDNFDISVDHVVELGSCAFPQLIDAVGGVAVPFDTRIVDSNVALDVPAGCHTFSGDEALAYVRSRHLRRVDEQGVLHEDPSADLGRIARQQDLLTRMLGKARDQGLLQPEAVRSLIRSLQDDLVTEAGFTVDEMVAIAGAVADIPQGNVGTYQVDVRAVMHDDVFYLEPQLASDPMISILSVFRGTSADLPAANLVGDVLPSPTLTCP